LTTVVMSLIVTRMPSVIPVIARMTYTPAAHSVRNQTAQDPLCVEHAPHICRLHDRFASTE
jgi:hypothetical protein